ncbi:uncharacterized protein LOC124327513 [Daphnia pulicaria]|uniref:uncharacterized protein LOC124327513 n=1 Tax=Daphnia pulicaria TaxID=35523 RepID=UPI001EEBD0CF|nr:uncharacterized protein LOC124327513 [Daphnia pulicaria]
MANFDGTSSSPLLKLAKQPGSRYNGGLFRGTYPTIGLPPGSSSQELLFHVVSSDQTGPDGKSFELVSLVPKDWVDVDFKYFLHPHPDFNVNGLYTWEWLLINFKKRRYPELTFVEYDIMDLTTECPVPYEEAENEISKVLNTLQETQLGSNESLESWERPPKELSFCSNGDTSSHALMQLAKRMDNSKNLSRSFSASTPNNRPGSGSKPFPTTCGNIAKKPRTIVSKKGAASKGTDDERNFTHSRNQSVISLDSEPNASSNRKNSETRFTGVTALEKRNSVSNGETGIAVQNNIPTNTSDDAAWKAQVLQGINATNSLLKHLIPSKKFIETCLDKNMDHFRKTVDRNLSLPLNRLEDVMILNTALIDLDLSVSLCAVQITDLGHISYCSTLAKRIMDCLMTCEICTKMQWKTRTKDSRPGICPVVNILSIFRAVMTAVLEKHNKTTSMAKIVFAVQEARRQHQCEYYKSLNMTPVNESEEESSSVKKKCEKSQAILLMQQRTKAILQALENYRE